MIRTTEPLAALVERWPAAAGVFQSRRLDYYCRGEQSLSAACAAAGLDAKAVADEIESAGTPAPGAEDWTARPVGDLVRHILRRFHDPLHPEILRLQALARRVESLHAASPDCPRGLVRHLEALGYALEEHLAKEEEIVFPLLAHGHFERAAPAIRAMMAEHEQHAAALRRTRELTHDFGLPADACPAWQGLAADLERLEHSLMDHMHMENYVLFPRALAGVAH